MRRLILFFGLLSLTTPGFSQRFLGLKIGVGASMIRHERDNYSYPSPYGGRIQLGPAGQFGIAFRSDVGKFSSFFVEGWVNHMESTTSIRWAEFDVNGNLTSTVSQTYRDHLTSGLASFYYGVRISNICATVGAWLGRGIQFSSDFTDERELANGERFAKSETYRYDNFFHLMAGLRTGVLYNIGARYSVETHYFYGIGQGSVNLNGDIYNQLMVSFRYNFLVREKQQIERRPRRTRGRGRDGWNQD